MRKISSEIQLNETRDEFPFRIFWDTESLIVNTFNHWHTEMELLYVVDGSMPVYINGDTYHLQQGDMMLSVSGDIHGVLYTTAKRLVVQFKWELLESKYFSREEMEQFQKKFAAFERVSLFWPDAVKRKTKQILSALKENEACPSRGVDYKMQAVGAVYEMVLLFWKSLPCAEGQAEGSSLLLNNTVLENLKKVFSYVNEHYVEDIRIETMAGLLNFSENYFIKYWKRYAGIPFHEYLNEYRVDRAIRLLLETNLPVSQICYRAGFQNFKTFHRVFKSVTGFTPNRYRQSALTLETFKL